MPALRLIALVSSLLSAAFLLCSSPAAAEEANFYLVWGTEGNWDGSLELQDGRLIDVKPFRFEANRGDRMVSTDEHKAVWQSSARGNVRGIRVRTELGPHAMLNFKTKSGARTIKGDEIPAIGNPDKLIRLSTTKECLLIVGCGNPNAGPHLPPGITLPPLYVPPQPKDAVQLADTKADEKVTIELSQAPPGAVAVRRAAAGDGRLYLEVYSPAGPLKGRCSVKQGERHIADRALAGALWLCRQPRIGIVELDVIKPASIGETWHRRLVAPTTLVEIRGRRLFLNGEPLLVKGTLPGDLNDEDAAYLKSLGANTIRTAKVEYLDRYKFMGVVPLHGWGTHFCEKANTDEEFLAMLDKGFAERIETYRPTMSNPRLLILQLANEQVMGLDRWTGHLARHPFDRLDYLLARCYNAYKPLDPMVPLGYANCAFGYRTPSFLDIYLHNTYLGKDRGWPPLEEFARFEGCDERPFLHTEFGANNYMPQVYSQGPNTPVMEKLHAWGFPQRWAEFIRARTVGGINYRMNDGKPDPAKERQFTNFGIMTFDRKPKLACWELWHLWRDFEVKPSDDVGGPAVRVDFRRDHSARDCRLSIEDDGTKEVLSMSDFSPNSGRAVRISRLPRSFRWRIDYTTHGGLTMVACGACPAAREADEFLARLADRSTYPFLRELLDAEVVAADGRRDNTTLKDLERSDGVVTACFRKPSSRVYVAAFARRATEDYVDAVNLDVAFAGRVFAVDEMTGQPVTTPVEVEPHGRGLRIKNVRVPYLPERYSQRLITPLHMPVFRIDGPSSGANSSSPHRDG